MNKYVNRKTAAEKLGVHYHTLYAMAKRGDIETLKIGKHQKYNVQRYLHDKEGHIEVTKRKICYCRVSSAKQRGDLKRQIAEMRTEYPKYEMITDIGSGMNFKRPGLKKIIDYGIKGEIEVVAVAYKDRIARIGYDLIENIIEEYSNGKIEIKNKEEEETAQEEITKDLLAIMNVYVAKVNGTRKYKNTKKRITRKK